MKKIAAIELAGACNLEATCHWCPMAARPRYRKRGLMSDETFARALSFLAKVERQSPLSLHNFGEPLLHPKLDIYAAELAKLGPIAMSINGTLVTPAWAERLARVPWDNICVSFWGTTEQYQSATRLLCQHGIKVTHNEGVTHDFAGQAPKGRKDAKLFRGCQYLNQEMGVIWWDGRIAPCCVTDQDADAIGDVTMSPADIRSSPISLCPGCHHAL